MILHSRLPTLHHIKGRWEFIKYQNKKMLDNGLKQYTVFFGVGSVFESMHTCVPYIP